MPESRNNVPNDELVNTIPAENGTTWVEIASSGSSDEARLLQGFLEAEGIAAQIESLEPSFAPTNFGSLGDIRIYVSRENEPRAQELLKQREIAYEKLDDDSETVVTDEGPATIDDDARAENDEEV